MHFLRPQSPAEQLQKAACGNDVLQMTALLEQGLKADSRDALGDTALMWAAALGHRAMVDLLMNHGANPKIANPNGDTPAHLAARQGFLDLAWHFCTLHPALHRLPNHAGETVEGFLGMPTMSVEDTAPPVMPPFQFPSRGVLCR